MSTPGNGARRGRGKYNVKRLLAIALVLALIALFVRLGFWQLARAEEKRALLDAQNERALLPPLTRLPSDAESAHARYRRVSIAGRYDPARQILLDNQVYNGRAGYQALTPLHPLSGGCAVLVNRGWVPAGADRNALPPVPMTQIEGLVEGRIDYYPSVGMRLQGADQLAPGYPVVVQNLDAAQLAGRLGYCLLPYQIQLAPDAGEGYVREWKMQHIDPDKSLGYAFQWFAMAAGLAIYSAWIATRRPSAQSEQPVDEQDNHDQA